MFSEIIAMNAQSKQLSNKSKATTAISLRSRKAIVQQNQNTPTTTNETKMKSWLIS